MDIRPPSPPTEAALRWTVHNLVRRSAIYCEVIVVPIDRLLDLKIMSEELLTVAEYSDIEPDGSLVFLGELSNGYEWQVRCKIPSTMSNVSKPVMLAHAKLDLQDLKSTAQQLVDAAWSANKDEARNTFTRDLHKNAIFEVVMETLFGQTFFDEHYNPREEELKG